MTYFFLSMITIIIFSIAYSNAPAGSGLHSVTLLLLSTVVCVCVQTERQCEDEQCGERAVSHRVCSTTDTETQSAKSLAGEDTSSVADRRLQPAATSVSAALCHDIRRKSSSSTLNSSQWKRTEQ